MKIPCTIQLGGGNTATQLRESLPTKWEAAYVTYAQYNLSHSEDSAGQHFVDIKQSALQVAGGKDIKPFLAELAKSGTFKDGKSYENHMPCKLLPELSIPVLARCYVIIHLTGTGWQFRKGAPALTTENDWAWYNGQLRHVVFNASGGYTEHDAGGPATDGSTLVYFSVVYRESCESHLFNFHLEYMESGKPTVGAVIDPDIPNDGGTHIPFYGAFEELFTLAEPDAS